MKGNYSYKVEGMEEKSRSLRADGKRKKRKEKEKITKKERNQKCPL